MLHPTIISPLQCAVSIFRLGSRDRNPEVWCGCLTQCVVRLSFMKLVVCFISPRQTLWDIKTHNSFHKYRMKMKIHFISYISSKVWPDSDFSCIILMTRPFQYLLWPCTWPLTEFKVKFSIKNYMNHILQWGCVMTFTMTHFNVKFLLPVQGGEGGHNFLNLLVELKVNLYWKCPAFRLFIFIVTGIKFLPGSTKVLRGCYTS